MKRLSVLLLLCLTPLSGQAAVYKCKNPDGSTRYADRPCPTESTKMPLVGAGPSQAAAGPDAAGVEACLAHLKTSRGFNDAESVRVESHRSEWVAVKDIGSRKRLHLMVNAKNEYGAYGGAEAMSCLMMGDGRTVNTQPYELVE